MKYTQGNKTMDFKKETITTGLAPVLYLRESIPSLHSEGFNFYNINKNFNFVHNIKRTIRVNEEIKSMNSYIDSQMKYNLDLNLEYLYVIVYDITYNYNENSSIINLAINKFKSKLEPGLLNNLHKLYFVLHENFYQVFSNDDIYEMLENIYSETEIPRQVEKLMNNDFDFVKYYKENYINPGNIVKVKTWGENNVRLISV